MASRLYPLRFRPVFRRYLWGGRRLGTLLGKSIGSEPDYAESWEVVDHGDDQSVVASGPLEGSSLRHVLSTYRAELLGKHADHNVFPLLFKFLDANENLSVQVHPNDAQARKRPVPDLGKTEAWVVMDAQPGSVVYAGLKRGFDRPVVERELERGTLELCLHRFSPQVGDCLFIPAGTVHAVGKGLLVAEIQQASDVTFRLFDWNRLGPDGRPRALHLDEGLEVIDFSRGPIEPQQPQPTKNPARQRLVHCDKFILDRWTLRDVETFGGDDRFHLLAVLQGRIRLEGDRSAEDLVRGQTVLLPAGIGRVTVTTMEPAQVLDAYLP